VIISYRLERRLQGCYQRERLVVAHKPDIAAQAQC
jgi:hypothetical protein